MNLPQVVTPEVLRKHAAEDETLAVRVLVRQIHNPGQYTLRGRFRRYVAIRDDKLCCHVIDVPLSLWSAGMPKGAYQDNLSVGHDIQGTRPATKAPLVTQVVPWRYAKEPEAQGSGAGSQGLGEEAVATMRAFRELCEVMGAPPIILEAIGLLQSEKPEGEKEVALREVIRQVLEEPATETQDWKTQDARLEEQPTAPELPSDAGAVAVPGEEEGGSETPPPGNVARESGTPAAAARKRVAKKAGKKAKTSAERQKEFRERKKKEREAAASAGAASV